MAQLPRTACAGCLSRAEALKVGPEEGVLDLVVLKDGGPVESVLVSTFDLLGWSRTRRFPASNAHLHLHE